MRTEFFFGLLANCASSVRIIRAGFRFPGTRFERNVLIKGRLSHLKLGNQIVIQSGVVLHLGGQKWCGKTGGISIGSNSLISPNCVLYGAGSQISIGSHFDCGPFVGIYASRTDYRRRGKHIFGDVVIGKNVVAFSHVVIGPNVEIGDNSVIAAGSVVLKNVPKSTLVGGIPARVIRKLDSN